jgi:hypothetical protein
MHNVRVLAAAFFSSAFLCAPALAQDDETEAPGCFVEIRVTEALVRDAGMFDYHGFAGEGATPAFVTGGLSPTRDTENAGEVHGTAVFLRDASGAWRAYLPRPGESVIAAYASHDSGAIIFITQWQSEGPGQSWTLLRSADGLASAACTNVDFPDALNQPNWSNESLDLVDLDIAANGRGELIGQASWERERDAWFVYRTRDDGATWSAPRKISRERQARAGRFTPIAVDAPAPEVLVADLQRFAAGR